jgi:hypothetical protein
MALARKYAAQDAFDYDVASASAQWQVAVPLIKAIIGVESSFRPDAINKNDPGWAWGLMQMIPATAAGLGYTGPMQALLTNTALAVTLGTQLLRENLTRTKGDLPWAVSAYNGGWLTRIGNGRFTNQAYVDRVLQELAYFESWEGAKSAPSFRGTVVDTGVVAGGRYTPKEQEAAMNGEPGMHFLNGRKTVIGLGGLAAAVGAALSPDVVQAVGERILGIVQGVFGLLSLLGLIHKKEKRA